MEYKRESRLSIRQIGRPVSKIKLVKQRKYITKSAVITTIILQLSILFWPSFLIEPMEKEGA